MTTEDIRLLYEYDRWANSRVLESVSTLSAEQFTRDLGGSFKSVRDTLLHILAGEWGWITYWKDPHDDPAFLSELSARRRAMFRSEAFPNAAAVRSKWTEIEKEQIEFVNQLADESLAKIIPVRGRQLSLMHLMQHLANHSTYHRGQISLMMRQLGAQPVATDFHMFVGEGRAKSGQ